VIRMWVYNRPDDGTPPRKPEELPAPQRPPFLEFIFPNLWQNRISDDLRIFVAFAPVDEENGMFYLRYYQRMVRLPVIKNLFNWAGVLGMATYADGGLLASKPYISSGSYIHKMGDYCSDCRFDVHQKLGENACPFNYQYWYFLDRQREKLSQNPRMAVIYQMLERKSAEEKAAIRRESEHFLARLPQGNAVYLFQYDAG